MLPDRVSNPGPLTYESGTLPILKVFNSVFYITTWGWYIFCICKSRQCMSLQTSTVVLKFHGEGGRISRGATLPFSFPFCLSRSRPIMNRVVSPMKSCDSS